MALPAKILLVDDEPHVRAFFAKLVRANLGGPAIFEAADAAAAVALYERERPDLVLLDINLIGTSGLAVLKQLRTLDPEAVVVMLTAVNVLGAVREAVESGASGYILKDTPHNEISQALRDIVQTVFGDNAPARENP